MADPSTEQWRQALPTSAQLRRAVQERDLARAECDAVWIAYRALRAEHAEMIARFRAELEQLRGTGEPFAGRRWGEQ